MKKNNFLRASNNMLASIFLRYFGVIRENLRLKAARQHRVFSFNDNCKTVSLEEDGSDT